MSNPRIRLFHWKEAEAKERIELLTKAGYDVEWDIFAPEGYRALRNDPPAAYVIDLTRLPSHGREVGSYLRQQKATRHVPLVFVEGEPEKLERVKKLLPDAIYTTWGRIRGALKKAIAEPPREPVVPASSMAGYSGTPLPKKLGIKENAVVILAGAPDDFVRTLGDVPPGVKFKRQARGANDLVLWFTTSRNDLEKRVRRMGELAGSAGLWIIWPKKASGVQSDLTQAIVREVGLASGLVDYKVCAVDATWSGLRFARRKTS